jgi:hypothetical protein
MAAVVSRKRQTKCEAAFSAFFGQAKFECLFSRFDTGINEQLYMGNARICSLLRDMHGIGLILGSVDPLLHRARRTAYAVSRAAP